MNSQFIVENSFEDAQKQARTDTSTGYINYHLRLTEDDIQLIKSGKVLVLYNHEGISISFSEKNNELER